MAVILPPTFGKNYTIESFFDELDVFLKDNLNPFMDQMNTDKGDTLLDNIPDEGIYFQTLNVDTINQDPYLYYGEVDVETVNAGPESAKTYTVNVGIVQSFGNDAERVLATKLLRYREVLEALFETGWNRINKRVKLEVTGHSPYPTQGSNSADLYVGIGVRLDLTLT